MSNLLSKLKPFYDATYKITMLICKLLLVGDILITSFSVAGRFISFIPDPAWSEEIVLTFMAYMTVLSAALALRTNTHIRMSALDRYLPEKLVQFLDVLADVIVFAFAIIMIVEGWKYASTIGSKGYFTSIPTLSKFWRYFPIPLAGVSIMIFELETVVIHIQKLFTKGEHQV